MAKPADGGAPALRSRCADGLSGPALTNVAWYLSVVPAVAGAATVSAATRTLHVSASRNSFIAILLLSQFSCLRDVESHALQNGYIARGVPIGLRRRVGEAETAAGPARSLHLLHGYRRPIPLTL